MTRPTHKERYKETQTRVMKMYNDERSNAPDVSKSVIFRTIADKMKYTENGIRNIYNRALKENEPTT